MSQKSQVRRRPMTPRLMFKHFFSSTLWGVIGGIVIITALYVSIVRQPNFAIQNIHVRGNQVVSSFEIAKEVFNYGARFSDVLVPYPNRVLQSTQALRVHIVSMFPEVADATVEYKGFNDVYITVMEQEARIVHCNTLPNKETTCFQRSRNGRPLLETPQNDFDLNPKLNTSIFMVNNILPPTIASETLSIYRLLSTSQHRVISCAYDDEEPDYECLMSTQAYGVVSVYIDAPSSKLIADSAKPIIDVVLQSIPPTTEELSYIDLRFYPKVVYK